MKYLNIATVRRCTEAEGPGKRFALWCQGCSRKCKGCCNPGMQPFVRRHVVATSDLKRAIEESRGENGIEGVSFIGGEPVLQAEGLADIACWCKSTGLSVLMFTGFLYRELKDMRNPFVDDLLSHVDILVDGPYVETMPDYGRDWVGSTNQNVIFLTGRYSPGIEKSNGCRRVECYVTEDGVKTNGWPVNLFGAGNI